MRKPDFGGRVTLGAAFLLGALSAVTWGQSLVLVSSERATGGQKASSDNSFVQGISANGRWIVYASDSTNLVAGQTDPIFTYDLFLYDSMAGTSVLVSRSAGSAVVPANQQTTGPATISGDGRYVAFESPASDLVTGQSDAVASPDVFLFDRVSGSMTLVSHIPASMTTAGGGPSTNPIISRNGRFVAFESVATDLVATAGNGSKGVFLFDRQTGGVSLVSRQVGTVDTSANNESKLGSISADGAWVAFLSKATDLAAIAMDLNFDFDVYLFERATGDNTLVSHAAGMALAASSGPAYDAQISADGDWVAFECEGTNLVVGQVDGSSTSDVFLYDRVGDTNYLASRSTSGAATAANGVSYQPRISDDGGFVAFVSAGTDLVLGGTDTNADLDFLLFDRGTGGMTLVSHSAGSPTTAADDGVESIDAMSGDGLSLAYSTRASNVVAGQVSSAIPNVFLFHSASGGTELVSHVPGLPATAADGVSWKPHLSQHGNLVFDSGSANLGFTDSNSAGDVFGLLPGIFTDGFDSGSTSAWGQAVP